MAGGDKALDVHVQARHGYARRRKAVQVGLGRVLVEAQLARDAHDAEGGAGGARVGAEEAVLVAHLDEEERVGVLALDGYDLLL